MTCYARNSNTLFPVLSTLQQYVRRFNCPQGIQTAVMQLVASQMSQLPVHERLVAIGFDEMNIDQDVCYDQLSDNVLGPYKKVQVVMMRCLMLKLKQPVYYNFDTKMTKALLFDIIIALEAAQCKVIAIVSDLGPENRALHKQLQLSWNHPSFENPSDASRAVWCFADVPHLMKLLRNHLLDQGIVANLHKKTI